MSQAAAASSSSTGPGLPRPVGSPRPFAPGGEAPEERARREDKKRPHPDPDDDTGPTRVRITAGGVIERPRTGTKRMGDDTEDEPPAKWQEIESLEKENDKLLAPVGVSEVYSEPRAAARAE